MSTLTVMPNWGVGRPDEAATAHAERERALARRFFLVRIAGNAGYDVMRCTRCNGRHTYLSLMCRPQPFSGASRGIYAYYHTLGVAGAELYMTPAQRARFQAAAHLFGNGRPAADLSTAHPRTARQIATPERDADIGAISIGVLEEVSPLVARRLVAEINARGLKPPLVVEGLEGGR